MSKRDYYELLGVDRNVGREHYQVGISQEGT